MEPVPKILTERSSPADGWPRGRVGLTGVTRGGAGQFLSETRLDANGNCVVLLRPWRPQQPYFWCLGRRSVMLQKFDFCPVAVLWQPPL